MKNAMKDKHGSQELLETARFILELPHDKLAAWVDEPVRAGQRIIAEVRAERDREIAAWSMLSAGERARIRAERRTKPLRAGRSGNAGATNTTHIRQGTGASKR